MTDVGVALPLRAGEKLGPFTAALGIWDTGASTTAIDVSLVDQLGLKEVDRQRTSTARGVRMAGVYYVSIRLPNRVIIPELRVVDGEISGGPEGTSPVLIGMDIIGAGDFAISTHNGETKFTYRLPPQENFDFVQQPARPTSPPEPRQKIGRNDACPCGSGKKYKRCHGG